jgi:isocitrate dehydrogenase (NAD+)
MLSASMMLRHLGEQDAGDRLERAVAAVLADGRDVTPDLRAAGDDRPSVGTRRMAEAVAEQLRGAASMTPHPSPRS